MKIDNDDIDLYNGDDLYNDSELYNTESAAATSTTKPKEEELNVDELALYQDTTTTSTEKTEDEKKKNGGEKKNNAKTEDAMSIDGEEKSTSESQHSNYDFSRNEKYWCVIYTKKGSLEVCSITKKKYIYIYFFFFFFFFFFFNDYIYNH